MPMVRKAQGVLCPVRDLARAKAFYGETLGLPLREEDPEGRWVEFGPPRGPGILLYQGAAGSGGGAMFPVRNAQRTLRRLKRLGVQVGDLVEVPGVMIIGTFYDPDGNPHHLVQSLRPKAPRRRRASEGGEVAPPEPQP
jgi:predicted enzyme related to lactoylglutathione lyase